MPQGHLQPSPGLMIPCMGLGSQSFQWTLTPENEVLTLAATTHSSSCPLYAGQLDASNP